MDFFFSLPKSKITLQSFQGKNILNNFLLAFAISMSISYILYPLISVDLIENFYFSERKCLSMNLIFRIFLWIICNTSSNFVSFIALPITLLYTQLLINDLPALLECAVKSIIKINSPFLNIYHWLIMCWYYFIITGRIL